MEKKTHDKIAVAVDLLLFTIEEDELKVLLAKREQEPFQGKLAFPGVAVQEQESLQEAARRCLREKTGMESELYLEQLYTFGDDCNRDPRNRVISVSYFALVPAKQLRADMEKNQINMELCSVSELLKEKEALAFDHGTMLEQGRERLKGKVAYSNIAFYLVEDEFTLPELQRVYEILLGKPLYKANFRNSMKELIEETGGVKKEGACRPSKLYCLKKTLYAE